MCKGHICYAAERNATGSDFSRRWPLAANLQPINGLYGGSGTKVASGAIYTFTSIMRAHGGEAFAHSENRMTVFELVIPL